MEHTWSYNGENYVCDICDCECYEALDSALNKLSRDMAQIEYKPEENDSAAKLSVGEKLRHNCQVIEEFFAIIFGGEKSKSILGERYNLMNYLHALASFICYVNEEISALSQSGEKIREELLTRIESI